MSCGSIGIEHCLQLVHPGSFFGFQLCLQYLLDDFVDSLDLSVGLGVVYSCKALLDPQRFTKLNELLASELVSLSVTIC